MKRIKAGCLRLAQGFTIVLVCSVATVAQRSGVIQGSVIEENGALHEGAQVNWYDRGSTIEPPEAQVQIGILPSVTTDASGYFRITHLIVGHRYLLVAKDEEAGYPDMAQPLYNPDGKIQDATAHPVEQAPHVTIRLGPKAGRIEWEIKDALTAAPFTGITFAIYRMDRGGQRDGLAPVGGGAPGKYSWLVPSDVPVTVEFSAPGYNTWYYPGTSERASRAFLYTGAGETMRLDVFMQPEANSRPHSGH